MSEKIVGYRGLANEERLIITGHAFSRHKIWDTIPAQNRLRNFRQTVTRFRLRPLKNTAIDVMIDGDSRRVRTNRLGLFTCEFRNRQGSPGWYHYWYRKMGDFREYEGEYKVVDPATTGVISDIDDTVLVSHSTRLIRKMSLILFRNAYTRTTIPFIKHWHGHISQLNHDTYPDDFFYVSNSEWNLYDFLEDFFEFNGLPKGVFLLQNLKRGLRDLVSAGSTNQSHKYGSIRFLMNFFPEKPFILIGDNGQRDMDIYSMICRQSPERVKGIMIRKLSGVHRERKYELFKQRVERSGIPFLHYY